MLHFNLSLESGEGSAPFVIASTRNLIWPIRIEEDTKELNDQKAAL